MATDASLGWGTFCHGVANRGPWRSLECKSHINSFKLNALKFAILTFTRMHATF